MDTLREKFILNNLWKEGKAPLDKKITLKLKIYITLLNQMYDKLKNIKIKKVLITGNTGFKGAWLTLFLKELGAKVVGYSDKIKWKNAVFDYKTIMNIEQIWGDIRDYKKLKKAVLETEPDFIFHLAAQPLVIEGLKNPFNTFTTNINGTLNLIDIVSNHFKNTSLI